MVGDGLGQVRSDGWELAIVDASGEMPRKIGALALPEGESAAELLVLDAHRVLVIGYVAGNPLGAATPPTRRRWC